MQDGLLGARAANAGTEFHIVWAVTHVLGLLVPGTDLLAVGVEGVGEVELGEEADPWQGVDLALFYGGDSLSTAARVEFQQLKYSTAKPDSAWTIARLCKAKDKGGKNSVISRLAQAYRAAVKSGRAPSAIKLKLVSNQPVHPDVQAAVTVIRAAGTAQMVHVGAQRLLEATGLAQAEASNFFSRLDLSECGTASRFEVQARVIRAIQEVSTPNSRQIQLELWSLVHKRMMPGQVALLTKESVIGAMLYGTSTALQPCPPVLHRPKHLVQRAVTQKIVDAFATQRRLCLHGQGGRGKTTVLLDLESLLPEGSELLVFDCYGGGTYMDSDGQRHLPKHAFLQLCNELSARLGTPLLIPPPGDVEYVREFADRLRKGSQVVQARNPRALLVVAVDAADNSIKAAASRDPPERSFVREFAQLSELPHNVRLLVSARTSRRGDLRLSGEFHPMEVPSFSEDELAQLCRIKGHSPTAAWVSDAHLLSSGSPRVLSYAFRYADETGRDALEYLRPTGKTLYGVFEERMVEALTKSGDEAAFDRLCASLSALQRPILLPVLARVANLTESALHDVLGDMAPGIVEQSGEVTFSDEDFEHFIDKRGATHLPDALQAAAEELMREHRTSAYCAEHVASALLRANRGSELLQLAHEFPEPKAIRDPVRRREVQLQRLKLAMHVAQQAGDTVKSITVMLRGARALRTDSAVRKLLQDNMDLSARFAAESLKRNILLNREEAPLQGAALSQLMLAAAKQGDHSEARAMRRQFDEWVGRCLEYNQSSERNRKWQFGTDEIVALAETTFLIDGVQSGLDSLARWRPRSLMLPSVIRTARNLILGGHAKLVEAALGHVELSSIWPVVVQTILAQAGYEVDTSSMDRRLEHWVRRRWVTSDATSRHLSFEAKAKDAAWPLLLQAAEIVTAKAGMQPGALKIFETLSSGVVRTLDGFVEGRTDAVDCALRAYCILEMHQGRSGDAGGFFGTPNERPALQSNASRTERERHAREKERREEAVRFINQLIPFHHARSRLVLDKESRLSSLAAMSSALDAYGSNDYQSRNDYDRQQMRKRLKQSVAELVFIDGGLVPDLVKMTVPTQDGSFFNDREIAALTSLSVHPDAQDGVLGISLLRAPKIQNAKEPATSRAEQMMSTARLLKEISPPEASALVTSAAECLQDVDYDVAHELRMFRPFSRRVGPEGASLDQRRMMASHLIDVSARTWSFLGDSDAIPWDSLIEALTRLDPSVALAAAGRWADEGVAPLASTLSCILETVAASGAISAPLCTALSYLTGALPTTLLKPLLRRVAQASSSERSNVLEELARISVLYVDGRRHVDQVRLVSQASEGQETTWLAQAAKVAAFVDHDESRTEDSEDADERSVERNERSDELAVSSSVKHPFTTPEEIAACVKAHATSYSASNPPPYVSEHEVLAAVRERVRLGDRRKHLEALEQLQLRSRYAVPEGIAQAVVAWAPESPAVRQWCAERLPSVLSQHLPWFIEHLAGSYADESNFIPAAALTNDVWVSSILEGLERHAAECDPAMIYRAIGVIANLIEPQHAASVLSYHLKMRAADIDADYVRMDLGDIPNDVTISSARLLNACMGDIELSVRWQAAHAMRACARMKMSEVVDIMLGFWGRTSERSYRTPNAPFYWSAARLWQMLTAARVARECPDALSRQKSFLLHILNDAEYPHVLVREYARDALVALRASGAAIFAPNEESSIDATNTTKVPHAKQVKRTERGFDRFGSREDRRFHFDSTDTLPYWYEYALKPFANVSSVAFLDAAEKWIIDRWGAVPSVWKWMEEPRKARFERGRLSGSHRHGLLPSEERYSTHLEWHAMFCVVGEFLESEPLVRVKPDAYESLQYFLRRHQLTESPRWLSDFRRCKPLERSLWQDGLDEEGTDAEWLADVHEQMMLEYLGPPESPELPVSSRESGIGGQRRWSIEVSSALVNPQTAQALLRALQGARSSWDYALPGGNHHDDIDSYPFQLKKWISYPSKDVELDQDDLLRRQVRDRQAKPGERMRTLLNLPRDCDDELRWTDPDKRYRCTYVAWSDESTEADRHSSGNGCAGYRLMLNKDGLRRALLQSRMDLFVEITFTRRTKEYQIDDDDQEEPSEAECDYLVVLRGNGTIESARGPVGFWCTPGAGARTG